jgi:hypothetical protein
MHWKIKGGKCKRKKKRQKIKGKIEVKRGKHVKKREETRLEKGA